MCLGEERQVRNNSWNSGEISLQQRFVWKISWKFPPSCPCLVKNKQRWSHLKNLIKKKDHLVTLNQPYLSILLDHLFVFFFAGFVAIEPPF